MEIFIRYCKYQLGVIRSCLHCFNFRELYGLMKRNYATLKKNYSDDKLDYITKDRMYNPVSLFFVNGLVSQHRFPTLEDLILDFTLEDAVTVLHGTLLTNEEREEEWEELRLRKKFI
jgi:hypothetical protein